tara:strand:- start:1294 stop:1926 length:633 start_codon:yes stop_codon:yes gene_type:complete
MANLLSGGYGLRPIGKVGGNPFNNATTQYEIANDYSTAIYNGGIVIPLAGGTIAISDQAVAPLGVLGGVEYVDSVTGKATWLNYWPGSNSVSVDTNYPVKAFVYDDPMQLYVVVADGTNTDRATALADTFANCDMASVNSGSTNTGMASDMLDISTAATTNTLDVRIVGLFEDEGNLDYSAVGHQYIVRLNHPYNSGVGAAVGTFATTAI